MKSKTSSCNRTVLKKDITRFAPVWVLYTIFLLLSLLTILDEDPYRFTRDLKDSYVLMAMANLLFAPLCAQLLFGDLYNTRMCNALHALPIRRESWFGVHVTAGLLFAVVPYVLLGGFATILLGRYWLVGSVWILSAIAQYICFFGIAVFAVMCAGNRFSMLLVYGIINAFAGIAAWMIDCLYQPLLFGVAMDLDWLMWLCPIGAMVDHSEYISIQTQYMENDPVHGYYHRILDIAIGGDWWVLAVYAAVGIALAALALVLYRRRRLEVAGDFIAVRPLEPVFLVLYTLCAGTAVQIFSNIFSYTQGFYLFFAVGLVIGFFTGLMLLKRTLRIFTKKAFLQFVCLGVAVASTLVLTRLDPLGITRWVPEVGEVESVTIYNSSYKSEYEPKLTLTEEEDIETILGIHESAIKERRESNDPYVYTDEIKIAEGSGEVQGTNSDLTISYKLKSGKTVDRYYTVYTLSPEGQTLKGYYSTPECVLGIGDEPLEEYLDQFISVRADVTTYFSGDDMLSLAQAILADCENGTLSQSWDYHHGEDTQYWVEFVYKDPRFPDDASHYLTVRVYESSENSYKWLQDHDVLPQKYR